MSAQQRTTREAIAALGADLGPDVMSACTALLDAEQRELANRTPLIAANLAYGPHGRHRLDLYGQDDGEADPLPIMVFVPGGGFIRGDKGSIRDWRNANVGRTAAHAGFLGVVMNYRLAPDHGWPAGGEDVGAVVDWLGDRAREHGGDPERIALVGSSAGAVHIATYLQLRPEAHRLRCAVLLSGLYGVTELDDRDTLYYGEARLYRERRPLEAVTDTDLPLLIACAEFDPPRFQAEFLGLLQRRLERKGRLPRSWIASGHNHYTLPLHLGTSDERLADEIRSFAVAHCLQGPLPPDLDATVAQSRRV